MNFDQLGLVFDQEIKKRPSKIRLRDSVRPEVLYSGTVPSMFGVITLIWCDEGLCYLGFDEKISMRKIKKFFPDISVVLNSVAAKCLFNSVMDSWEKGSPVDLVVRGTEFQKRVWAALLHVPMGHVVSYGSVARFIGKPLAVRAVGSAVGSNPVSLLVPCHRVIQQSGSLSNYGWGDVVKEKILGIESEVSRGSGNPASRKNRQAG